MAEGDVRRMSFEYEESQPMYRWVDGYRDYNSIICEKCGKGSILPERVVNMLNKHKDGYCDKCGRKL